jgi:16S rRNA (guanine966-N2)-methyltransferase
MDAPLMKKTPVSSVRLIAGIYRHRLIRFPAADGLRPTPDRVRETLFNWLGQDLTGWTTLEPFAGSGALSFEALSRGAAHAVAWDANRETVAALKANAETLGTRSLEARICDSRSAIANETRSFDAIFLDPPFAQDWWDWLLPAAAARLQSGGFLYAEAPRDLLPAGMEASALASGATAGLTLVKTLRAGAVHAHLFRIS